MKHSLRWLVAAGMLAMTAGCGQGGALSTLGGSIITPTVQDSLRNALPQVLGPGSYNVTIIGLDTTGHANEVDINGVNMQPPGAPTIASMSAQFLDVNFSQASNTITHVGVIHLNLLVTATDLTTFLTTQKNIPGSTVTMAPPDQVGVTGTPDIPNVGPTAVSIQGHVVPSGADVNYVLDTVSANGSTVTDQTLLTAISNLYNPLVNLSGLPAHPNITAIAVSNAAMTISADGFFP